MKESVILSQCLEFLRLHNIYCWRQNTGAVNYGGQFVRFAFKGCSDIIGICPDGRFLAVECKRTDGGRLSDDQKAFLAKIKENNGVAIIANSIEILEKSLKNEKII